jgi:CDP-glucose 4,6-dehydratase
MFNNVYKDKVVLITGNTGFKGSWLSMWLVHMGARVIGVSDSELSSPSNFSVSSVSSVIEDYRYDVTDSESIKNLIVKVQPDFIFHLAAQALVRLSYENPVETIITNSIGSVNVLNALRSIDKKVVTIMITSDKAYDNVEWVWGYKETDRLGGKDPYSASKGMAELAIRSYIDSFFSHKDSNIRVAVARAGNVIGGGDWAVDRIVPDCMKAWSKKEIVQIRSPQSTRPWQHVLEPLSGYLCLAENLYQNKYLSGEAYNFGPKSDQNDTVSSLIEEMSLYWNQIKWEDVSDKTVNLHEAKLLKLNCDKALADLKWHSNLKFKETIQMTVEWYKEFYKNQNQPMYDFSVKQIETYLNIAKKNNLNWATND